MIEEITSGKAQLLDVRSEMEWNAGHADGAMLIPLEAILEGKTAPLDPSRKVYVYCRSGSRAEWAALYLSAHGFDAENIGGLADWINAGGELAA